MVVGAFALAFHGHPRVTGDIDIWIRRSPGNVERVVVALRAFGMCSSGISTADLLEPDTVVQLGFPPRRIDILTGLTGLDFDEAWENRAFGDLDGLSVAFIGAEDFLANKRACGRPKDMADAEEIERRRHRAPPKP